MAKTLKPNGADGDGRSASAGSVHKVADLKKVIRECAAQMIEIKKAREELNEQAGEIRQRLKDAGIQTKAFDFALRLKDMEQEARDDYLDSLRLNFKALSIGGQGDLFPGAVAAAAAAPSPEHAEA